MTGLEIATFLATAVDYLCLAGDVLIVGLKSLLAWRV